MPYMDAMALGGGCAPGLSLARRFWRVEGCRNTPCELT